jgi:capsular exopolysaccharide synthesis family protein
MPTPPTESRFAYAEGPGLDASPSTSPLAVLKKSWWLVVGVSLLVGVGAYEVSNRGEKTYGASAQMLLTAPAPGTAAAEFAAGVPSSPSDLAAIATAHSVLVATRRALTPKLGAQQAVDAVATVKASAAVQSALVTISATGHDPATPALVANQVVKQNLSARQSASQTELTDALSAARSQLRNDNQSFGKGSRLSGADQAVLTALQTRIVQLEQDQAGLVQQGQLITPAVPSRSAISPRPKQAGLIGVFGGLLLGLALVFSRAQVDRKLRRPEDFETALGHPVLASVPPSRALARQRKRPLATLPPAEAEAFQRLRMNLRYGDGTACPRSVAITSTGAAEGKSTVALNLAIASAQTGWRVLLIEAHAQASKGARVLTETTGVGMGSFLENHELALADVTQTVALANGEGSNGHGHSCGIDLLPSGSIPANAAGLLESARMETLIREAESQYDLVVIDTPPVGLVTDVVPILRRSQAILVVGRIGQLSRDDAQKLREQLDLVNAPVHGLIANFDRTRRPKAYGS